MNDFSQHWLDKFLNQHGLERSNSEAWILLAFAQYLDRVLDARMKHIRYLTDMPFDDEQQDEVS